MYVCMYVCMYVSARARACVRACVCMGECVRACVLVCVCKCARLGVWVCVRTYSVCARGCAPLMMASVACVRACVRACARIWPCVSVYADHLFSSILKDNPAATPIPARTKSTSVQVHALSPVGRGTPGECVRSTAQ